MEPERSRTKAISVRLVFIVSTLLRGGGHLLGDSKLFQNFPSALHPPQNIRGTSCRNTAARHFDFVVGETWQLLLPGLLSVQPRRTEQLRCRLSRMTSMVEYPSPPIEEDVQGTPGNCYPSGRAFPDLI